MAIEETESSPSESQGGGGTPYNSMLARIMRVDPNDPESSNKNMSLTALGAAAMGANDPAYQQAQADLEEARANLMKRLQTRTSGLDPKWLAFSAGMLSGGGGGSFGEGLGKGLKGYNEAAIEEQKREQDIASAQVQLQQSKINALNAQAGMGLNVTKAMSRVQTKAEQQAMSEGLTPGTPQFAGRVAAINAYTQAPIDMKIAAAALGKNVNEITKDELAIYQQNKELTPIAAKYNLDINTPDGRRAAQVHLASEKAISLLTQEQRNFLAQIGGDPTNPEDMKKVANLISESNGLDIRSKKAQIAASQASTTASYEAANRSRQETQQNAIKGDDGANVALAKSLGVPPPKSMAVTPGTSQLDRAKVIAKNADEFSKFNQELIKGADPSTLAEGIANAQRALQIVKSTPTGGLSSMSPALNAAKTAIDSNKQVLEKLSNLSISSIRPQGMTRITNQDLSFLQRSTFGNATSPQANIEILNQQIAKMRLAQEYHDFMQKSYAAGANLPEASSNWATYLKNNPISMKDAAGVLVPNDKRAPYQQYFSAPVRTYDANGREVTQ
jgi:hypothetical protein